MSRWHEQGFNLYGQRAILDLYSIETNRVDIKERTCHLFDD